MISCRRAQASDVDLYFRWANDPAVREHSFQRQEISHDTHVQWFTNKLGDQDAVLLVCHLNETPFGQVRFDVDENGIAWIGYSIDAQYRGRGLSAPMLQSAIRELFELKGDGIKIRALVKPGNIASAKAFEKIGFRRMADVEVNGMLSRAYEWV